MIVKRTKSSANVPKDLLVDNRITLAAKGLYAYLLLMADPHVTMTGICIELNENESAVREGTRLTHLLVIIVASLVVMGGEASALLALLRGRGDIAQADLVWGAVTLGLLLLSTELVIPITELLRPWERTTIFCSLVAVGYL